MLNYPWPRLLPFITLVRPHLEYAMQACSPNLFTDADCLEQIHRLATRLVKSFRRLPYEEQLRRLGRRRRLRGDLIVVYKMFSGGLDMDPSLFFIPPVRPGLRGHPFKVRRKTSFSLRLPTSSVTALSVNSFKRQIDSAWNNLLPDILSKAY